ncbi:hypothetical protein BLA60_32410 [Actinophytocola xinjiangensis]|uniref:4-amino-4-deoxy-L-arabinose transferase-like glycosyltransferase n=1 Tax=Actinophytocola xinjiangensis TaxID=485602 RepID=A0A7Z1AV43_9PSEU|nr:hypothetical protein [Actinophytocola xinjiangensis]OLF06340.1 hypothetical protein BLA60_32410 [Actinophytocola xinjiangensis]
MTSTVLRKDADEPRGDEEAEQPSTAPGWRARLTDTRVARLVELLALVPALAMVVEVSRAGKLQWLDYWYVLIRITNPDGSFKLGGIFTPQNEHPLMIPSLLYWLDAKLADGDNRVLGYLVIVIAAATVALLRSVLPRSLPPLVRAGLVVGASALIFSLQGMHMFVRSMSGSAWLTANLIVVISLILASRGKWWAAWGAGLLATASYGTAFALWPALAVLAVLRKERWAYRIAPLGIGVVVVGIWYILKPNTWIGGQPANDLGSLLFTFLTVVGKMWTADNAGFAVVAGALTLVLYVVLMSNKAAQDRALRFWWALGTYGILACGMIATARIDFGADFGLTSRYSSLAVMVAIPLLVLLAAVLYKGVRRNGQKIAVTVIGIGVVGFTLGLPTAADLRNAIKEHPLEAVAIRAGYGDALGPVLPKEHELEPDLRVLEHYPFNDSFSLGCGGPELGSTIDLSQATELPQPGTRSPTERVGMLNSVDDRGEADLITGWATGGTNRNADHVLCTVVVDGDDKVVGGGVSQLPRADVTNRYWGLPPDVGFKVLGPVTDDTRIVIIYESGDMRWLPPTVSETGDEQ